MFALITGITGGFLHVVSGPDHLAAIAPLAAETQNSSWRIGFKWGIGHSTGMVLIGSLLIFFRTLLPLETISLYSERLIGFILILIGIWGLQKVFRMKLMVYEHRHNQTTHIHYYHNNTIHSHTALFIGIIHGLAGSSHFFGVLPALAMPSQTEAVIYLSAFSAGTVLSMTIFASLVGILTQRFSFSKKYYKRILAGFCISAITAGCFWLTM